MKLPAWGRGVAARSSVRNAQMGRYWACIRIRLCPRDFVLAIKMTETSEKNQSLWLLTVSPVIWATHLMLSYATASIWCAKVAGPGGSLWSVRMAIAAYSVIAFTGIGITGWIGY